LLAALAVGVVALPATASAAEFEGTVVSVNRDAKTFRLDDAERGVKRIRVNRRTTYERVSGFGGLRVGMKAIEATVRRVNGRWVATHVERSGGGGRHGGRNGGDDD
jgi:hypothetical protein